MKKFVFWLLLLWIFPLLLSAKETPVDTAVLKGVINPAMGDYIVRAVTEAEKDGAILVIQIDTPGGLDGPMRKMAQKILSAEVPVIAFVYPQGSRAASAGVFICYACHIAAMTHGTNIGAAHPIFMSPFGGGGGGAQEKVMSEKATNDMVASIRSIATKTGRNIEWAEKAVRESVSIPAEEALKLKVVDLQAENLEDLLKKIKGRKITVAGKEWILDPQTGEPKKIEMTLAEKFLFTITDPSIAFILFLIGLMGLYYELSNPGLILPGVVGGISLIMALYALGTLPINFAGLFLLIFAFILFIADIYAPSHGFLTAGGVISLILGALMLLPGGAPYMRISPYVIGLAVLLVGGFFLLVMGMVATTFRRKSIIGKQGMLGATGYAKSDLNPEGNVWVEGSIWKARASAGEIKKGEKVRVLNLKDLKLLVEKTTDNEFAQGEK